MSTNDSRKRPLQSNDGTNSSNNSPGPSKNVKAPSDPSVPMTSEPQPSFPFGLNPMPLTLLNGFQNFGFPGLPGFYGLPYQHPFQPQIGYAGLPVTSQVPGNLVHFTSPHIPMNASVGTKWLFGVRVPYEFDMDVPGLIPPSSMDRRNDMTPDENRSEQENGSSPKKALESDDVDENRRISNEQQKTQRK